jgi:hypothetical protein
MAFMLATAFVHLIVAPHAFGDSSLKGLLFVASAVCALIAATGIQEGHLVWGWGLGTIVAGAALASYLMNVTIGLPGLPAEPDGLQEPLGLLALAAEALMLVLAAWVYSTAILETRRHPHHRMA